MRFGVFVLLLALALGVASSPALAQSTTAPPGKSKEAKDEHAKHPPKDKGQAEDDDDEEEPDNGPADDDGEPAEDEEPGVDDGEAGQPGDADDGEETDGGDEGGAGPADRERPAGGSGPVDDNDVPGNFTDSGGGEAGLAPVTALDEEAVGASSKGAPVAAEAEVTFEEEGAALSRSLGTEASPGVLALFVFLALALFVGIGGGMRALHGRIRQG